MKRIVGLAFALLTVLTAAPPPARAADSKIAVVAAENFYGDMAADRRTAVDVASIMNSPDQDPHLFETSPAVARQIAARRSWCSTAPTTIPGWRSC